LGVVNEHELDLGVMRRPLVVEKTLFNARRARVRSGSCNEDDAIGLTQTSMRPTRRPFVALIYDEATRDLLRVEPRHQIILVARRIAVRS
jgi:hypothetical protein